MTQKEKVLDYNTDIKVESEKITTEYFICRF